jgi:hypothetical protein
MLRQKKSLNEESSTVEFEHALIVGGTGMLEKASRYVSDRASHVTLVSRDADATRKRLGLPRANYISADWTDPAIFLANVKPAFALHPVDLILLWMHRSGQNARLGLIDIARGSNCHIVDVHGSGGANASNNIAQRRLEVLQADCRYNAVLLGAVYQGDEPSRWLTHDEISTAVIEAIVTRSDVVAGVV